MSGRGAGWGAGAGQVVVPLVSDTWTDAVRRGFYSTADQTLLSLLAAPGVRRVLAADHPRGVLSQLRRRSQGDRPAPRTPFLAGVRPFVVRTPLPDSAAGVATRYAGYDRQLRVAARRHGLRRPTLLSFNLLHAAHGDHGWASDVAFYAQDDEAAIPAQQHRSSELRAAYARVAASGMTVFAVSEELLDRINPSGRGVVVPNGVDAELWRVLPAPDRPDGAVPVLAYAGTVDDRLDVAAFAALAADGVRIRVAGPVADAAVGAALGALPGVELLGPLPRTAVVSLLVSADACLLAHRETELTRAMSPLKYYEYLCSGRPVVATRLGGVPQVGRSSHLVEPGGDYVGAVRAAVAAGGLDERERAALVEECSWRRRHAPVVAGVVAGRWRA